MNGLALRSEIPFNVVSLCAGGRGLDRALELAIPGARSVVYVERESFAVAGLVAQIEAGLVAPAAVWSDVRTFNGRPWRGLVSCLAGGIPCQPHSLAGRRGGSTDERDLWSPARRIVAQLRPLLVVIENVGGFLSAGADEVPGAERVRRDLRKLAYSVTGCIVRASDVRLPHERERVFVIGVADAYGRQPTGWGLGPGEAASWRPYAEPAGSGSRLLDLADARGRGQRREGDGEFASERLLAQVGGELGDANGAAKQRRRRELLAPQGQKAGRRDNGLGRADNDVVDTSGDDGRLHTGPREEGFGEADTRGRGEVVHTLGCGHDGWTEGSIGGSVGRDAEQLAGALRREQHLSDANGGEPAPNGRDDRKERGLSQGKGGAEHCSDVLGGGRPSLRPPGPGDAAAWRVIAADRPDLLPALSSYDRFRIAMRDEGLAPTGAGPAADLGPQEGQGRGVAGGAARWVDARTGRAVDPTVVQAAAQSALRRVADVMATRIDELRLLGNGVADAQGGLAIRIGLHDLAASGSAGAALLVRMMG